MILDTATFETPLGPITLFARAGRLCGLDFGERLDGLRRDLARRFGGLETRASRDPAGAMGRLEAYFAGNAQALDPIDVDPGGTPFQQSVWATLRTIPPGAPISYRDLAARIGRPGAVRAVGAANGRNPVALVIPCHRVIAADGTLGGYGGGIDRKRWLLAHEAAAVRRPLLHEVGLA